MKVRIKATGEVVNTADYWRVTTDWSDGWGNSIEFTPEEVEFLTDETASPTAKPAQKEVDWEQRRYEIAKDVLACRATTNTFEIRMDDAVHQAVRCADALIKRLKGE